MRATPTAGSSGLRPPNDTIVGRTREQAALRALLDSMLAGEGGLALLAGEAGIGKTTLVEALEQAADACGALVLTGNCYDLAITPPYGPWLEIADHYAVLGGSQAVPDALRRGAGVGDSTGQAELFAEIHTFLVALATQQPLLIVLEDLHWSDRASLDLLRYLARQVAALPLLFVVTYRVDEVTREHALFEFLPLLVREARAERIDLGALADRDVRALLAGRYRLTEPDESRLATYLQSRAEGNPFFLTELLRTLQFEQLLEPTAGAWRVHDLSRASVPPLVRQVLYRKLDRLGAATRGLLEVAAVIGQEVPVEVWSSVTAVADDSFADVIERAAELHVLEEARDGAAVRFTHALVREALYAGMALPRRRSWHRKIGTALNDAQRPSPGMVAYHFQQAGDPRAVDWLLRAAEEARAVYAPRSAIAYLTDAFEIAARLALPISAPAYRTRGQACETVGDFDGARRDYQMVREIAATAGDQQAEWQAHLDLGLLWASRDYVRAGEHFQQALRLAHELPDRAQLAHTLNRVGNWHMNVGQPDEGIRAHDDALAIFQDLNDRPGIAATLDLLGITGYFGSDLLAARRWFEQAIQLFDELGDRQGLASAMATLGVCWGDFTTTTVVPTPQNTAVCRAGCEQAIQLAREIGWSAGVALGFSILTGYTGTRGDYARALEGAREGLAIAEEIGHRQWIAAVLCESGPVYRDLFALNTAQQHIERSLSLATQLGSSHHMLQASAQLATVALLDGRLAEAESILRSAIGSDVGMRIVGQRLCWYARAEYALAAGEPDLALHLADRLIDSAPNISAEATVPCLAKVRGQALAALGRFEEGRVALDAARDSAMALGLFPLCWRIDAARGQLFEHQGCSDRAQQAFAAARSIVETLAARIPDEDLRDTFLHAALAQCSPRTQVEPGGAFAGLTPREVEVLRLVARGLTNPEIAEQLFISPHTVTQHVGVIFRKLQVNSRAAATRVAIEERII